MVIMDAFETEWSPAEPPHPIDCYVVRKLLLREKDGESRERDAASPSSAATTTTTTNSSTTNSTMTSSSSIINNNIIISTSAGISGSSAAALMPSPPLSSSLSPASAPLANSRYLLLDCRSFLAYSASHVRGSLNVHTNPILLRRRRRGIRTANVPSSGQGEGQAAESLAAPSGWTLPLAQLLPSPEARARLLAGLYAAVVLLDERTRDLAALRADSTLAMVALALGRETRGTRVYFLRGGYEKFHREFSELCLDAAITSQCKAAPALLPPVPIRMHTAGTPTYDQGGPVEILPFLYLGSAFHASRRELLDAIGITALLNVSADLPNHFEGLFTYKSIPVEDNHKADIGAWFLEAIDFIDSTRRGGGRVFVHCHAGVSRSATICLAYLMKTRRLRLDEAFEFVRQRRSVISPNFNFLGQLQSFEVQIQQQQQQQAAVRSPCALPALEAQPLAAAPAADECIAGDPGSRSPAPSLQRPESSEDGVRDPGPSHRTVAAKAAPLQVFSFPSQPSLISATDTIGFTTPLSASSPC